MPRPFKHKIVYSLPKFNEFIPKNADNNMLTIKMGIDEFETVRLIDYENLTQDECAQIMQIQRTTVQNLYKNARKKISISLVEGIKLIINGGHYKFCNNKLKNNKIISKGEKMKIAVAKMQNSFSGHFGHSDNFDIYTVDDKNIIGTENINCKEYPHGTLPEFLSKHNVDIVLVGGIGEGAINKLMKNNIKVVSSIKGEGKELVEKFLNGTLKETVQTCGHHHNNAHKCSCKEN